MTHPDLPNSRRQVTERAFERVWKRRGWQPADTTPEPAGDGGLSHADPEPAPARKRSKES